MTHLVPTNRRSSRLRRAILAALATTTIAGVGAAMADEPYSVSYTPEQVTTEAGMQALHAKIRQAAKEACPTWSEARSLLRVSLCQAEVTDDLVAKVDHPPCWLKRVSNSYRLRSNKRRHCELVGVWVPSRR